MSDQCVESVPTKLNSNKSSSMYYRRISAPEQSNNNVFLTDSLEKKRFYVPVQVSRGRASWTGNVHSYYSNPVITTHHHHNHNHQDRHSSLRMDSFNKSNWDHDSESSTLFSKHQQHVLDKDWRTPATSSTRKSTRSTESVSKNDNDDNHLNIESLQGDHEEQCDVDNNEKNTKDDNSGTENDNNDDTDTDNNTDNNDNDNDSTVSQKRLIPIQPISHLFNRNYLPRRSHSHYKRQQNHYVTRLLDVRASALFVYMKQQPPYTEFPITKIIVKNIGTNESGLKLAFEIVRVSFFAEARADIHLKIVNNSEVKVCQKKGYKIVSFISPKTEEEKRLFYMYSILLKGNDSALDPNNIE
jgi:hypothetical protein